VSVHDGAWRTIPGGRVNLDRNQNSHTLLEVCLHIIQEIEEVRGFSCSEASYGRVVLVGVICVSKLSVVNFYFSLRCAKPEPQDRERMKHAASDLFAKIGVVEPSFWFVLGGRGGQCGLGLCGGSVCHGDRGGCWRSLDSLSLSVQLLWLSSFPSSSSLSLLT